MPEDGVGVADAAGSVAVQQDAPVGDDAAVGEQVPERRLGAEAARVVVDELAPVEPDRPGDVALLELPGLAGVDEDGLGVVDGRLLVVRRRSRGRRPRPPSR